VDERAASLVAAVERQRILEPAEDTSARPSSRRKLVALLVLKAGAVVYAMWFGIASAEHHPMSLDTLFWAVVAVTWLVSARGTLRRLRATA
jgi:hypothetical protein